MEVEWGGEEVCCKVEQLTGLGRTCYIGVRARVNCQSNLYNIMHYSNFLLFLPTRQPNKII